MNLYIKKLWGIFMPQDESSYYKENFDYEYSISEDKLINCSFKYILNNYCHYIKKIREENDKIEDGNLKIEDYPINCKRFFYFIKDVFPYKLQKYVGRDELTFKGSQGKGGSPPLVPWISISQFDSIDKGYSISYLFKSDMSGFYLTLMLAIDNKNNTEIVDYKKNFMDLFEFYYDNDENNLNKDIILSKAKNINLDCTEVWKKTCTRSKKYEKAVIFNKYYSFDNYELKDENILKNDLNDFLKILDFIQDYQIFEKIDNQEQFSLDLEKNSFYLYKLFNHVNEEYNPTSMFNLENLKSLEKNFISIFNELTSHKYNDKFNKKIDFNKRKNLINLTLGLNRVSNENIGFFIYSNFDLNKKIFEFGLKLKLLQFNNKDITLSLNMVSNYLKDFFKNDLMENICVKDNKIIISEITYEDLNQTNLLENYKLLVNIYEFIIPYFICTIYNNLILNNIESQDNYNKINLKKEDIDKVLQDQNLKIDSFIINKVCAALNSGKNIIFNGHPGTGKTHLAKCIGDAVSNEFVNGYILTTATSDWSTFDTIGGLMPDKNHDGNLKFEPGKVLQSIKENKWLIIDEINRADIDKSFGQLFTILSGENITVELPYIDEYDNKISIKRFDGNVSFYDEENATYYIGKNWRIIGTMNYDDKDSLFDLSYAFMRRFMFIDINIPNNKSFKELMDDWCEKDNVDEFKNDLINIYEMESKPKDLGPALFKDMVDYIYERVKSDDNYEKDVILNEVTISFIIPQFEGLIDDDVTSIKKELGEIFQLDTWTVTKLDNMRIKF